MAQIWDCSVISREQAVANANLIATAPEMYAILARIEEIMESGDGYISIDMIKPVLRKAMGESEVSE